MSRMYKIDYKTVTTYNPLVGCEHDCIYCYALEIAKRSACPKCRIFEPHFHPKRLDKPPKFKAGETVFVCSMGDISFGIVNTVAWGHFALDNFKKLIEIIGNNPKTTFMLQSKNPNCFKLRDGHSVEIKYPDNLILGTTCETTYDTKIISNAPHTAFRINDLLQIQHKRKYITIEPILKFHLDTLLNWIKLINPEFVYIGNNNWLKLGKLNEPTLAETQELIKKIRSLGIEVREKSLRPAWYERIK